MAILKKEFISKDGKLKIKNLIYSEENIWLDLDQILLIFNDSKEKIESEIEVIEIAYKKFKKIKKANFVTKGESKTTKTCYNLEYLKKLNKIFKSSHYKEFIKWVKKTVYDRVRSLIFIKVIFSVIKIPKKIRLLGSLILPIIFSLLYYKFNMAKEIADLSLNILGINFALIIFNIPILIKVNEWNNEEITELLNKAEVPNNIGAKLTIQNATFLSIEMILTLIASSIVAIITLVFNITILWKNTLSIFVLILTLWHTFHIVWRIYLQQKRIIKSTQEKDMFTNEEIENEISNLTK